MMNGKYDGAGRWIARLRVATVVVEPCDQLVGILLADRSAFLVLAVLLMPEVVEAVDHRRRGEVVLRGRVGDGPLDRPWRPRGRDRTARPCASSQIQLTMKTATPSAMMKAPMVTARFQGSRPVSGA